VLVSERNVRSGPGLNFSVIGSLKQGDVVREIMTMDDWMEIVPPPDTYAFVAAQFLDIPSTPAVVQERAAPAEGSITTAAPAAPEAAPTQFAVPATESTAARSVPPPGAIEPLAQPSASGATVPSGPPVIRIPDHLLEDNAVPPASARYAEPVQPAQPAPSREATVIVEPQPGAPRGLGGVTPLPGDPEPAAIVVVEAPEAPPPPDETALEIAAVEEPPRSIVPGERRQRIVRREGLVRRTLSIQAPTAFELRATDTGERLDYLLEMSAEPTVRKYLGQRVIVTGEEMIDSRWPKAPVLEIHDIQLAP
jgi:hypothetical protein